ncbi:hypothetical protein C4J81_11500 [Deltaproteobacteria bacterium Smac51]|nr:hypothetical protein C4J81_11500 [Deltaproteobacteria bacterium Smac51]
MTQIKLVFFAAAITAFSVMWLRMDSLRHENDNLTQKISSLATENRRLSQEATAALAALKTREAEFEKIRAETNSVRRTMEELYEQDKTVREWADNTCPDDIIECLLR